MKIIQILISSEMKKAKDAWMDLERNMTDRLFFGEFDIKSQ